MYFYHSFDIVNQLFYVFSYPVLNFSFPDGCVELIMSEINKFVRPIHELLYLFIMPNMYCTEV